MSKRSFRSVPVRGEDRAPSYPTLDDFDRSSRRSFLARLGAALAGAGGLAVLGACVERRATMGDPAQPESRLDAGTRPPEGGSPRLDGGHPQLDSWPNQGNASLPDAPLDSGPHRPDAKILGGEQPEPDARIDAFTMGKAKAMDARIDEQVPEPTPGFAPPLPARGDGGSCKP